MKYNIPDKKQIIIILWYIDILVKNIEKTCIQKKG